MGVAATIGATLLGGFISGRAQQQQYNAAAQQAEVNAQIARIRTQINCRHRLKNSLSQILSTKKTNAGV